MCTVYSGRGAVGEKAQTGKRIHLDYIIGDVFLAGLGRTFSWLNGVTGGGPRIIPFEISFVSVCFEELAEGWVFRVDAIHCAA